MCCSKSRRTLRWNSVTVTCAATPAERASAAAANSSLDLTSSAQTYLSANYAYDKWMPNARQVSATPVGAGLPDSGGTFTLMCQPDAIAGKPLPQVLRLTERCAAGDNDLPGESHKLLVVEDEARCAITCKPSHESGHVVESVAMPRRRCTRRSVQFDLAVIDLGLPGMRGLELILQLRSGGKTFPTDLTARGNCRTVEGLAAGADDYLVNRSSSKNSKRASTRCCAAQRFTQSTIVARPALWISIASKRPSTNNAALTAYEYRILEPHAPPSTSGAQGSFDGAVGPDDDERDPT